MFLPSKRTAILPVVQLQHDNMTKRKNRRRIRNQLSKCSLNACNQNKRRRTDKWLHTLVPAPGSRTAHRAHVKGSLSPTPPTPLGQTSRQKTEGPVCHTVPTSAIKLRGACSRARVHCAVPAAYRKSNYCCTQEPERLAPAPFGRMKHWLTGSFLGGSCFPACFSLSLFPSHLMRELGDLCGDGLD